MMVGRVSDGSLLDKIMDRNMNGWTMCGLMDEIIDYLTLSKRMLNRLMDEMMEN